MPKSKHGKNHKKRARAYKEKLKQRQNSFRKAYIEMLNAKRQEEMESKIAESQESEMVDNIVEGIDTEDMQIDDIDGIDVDDMKID